MSTPLLIALLAFGAALIHGVVLDIWRQAIAQGSEGPSHSTLPDPPPRITVLIPARDAAATIIPLLQDLYAQRYLREAYEVLVVDDHSSDGTAAAVQGLARTWSGLRLISAESVQGKKAAIMQGVEAATGTIVLVTDADARCGPLRLARIAEYWQQDQPALLLMPVHTTGGKGLVAWLQRKEQAALQAATVGSAMGGRPVLANAANMAFDRDAFRYVGGFVGDRRASGDDMFLLQRMRKERQKVSFLAHPDVLVRVQPEETWSGFFAQRLRWAGKMWAYREGAGLLAAGAAVLFPWILLVLTIWLVDNVRIGQGLFYTAIFLFAAWTVWLVPIIRLVAAMERSFANASDPAGPPREDGSWSTLPALLLFTLYALAIAIVSIFVRPTWKGRRI
jgi:poly-beta-1,6-N-acetyl-D-glucosamine synthase